MAGFGSRRAGAEQVQVAKDTLTCRVDRGGPVLVSFFGYLTLGEVMPRDLAVGSKVHVVSMTDVGGTKMVTVQQRAQARDYVDIDAIVRHGLALPQLLAAGTAIYGRSFNPMLTLRALSYFGDVPSLDAEVRARLETAVRAFDPTDLPSLTPSIHRDDGRRP